MAQASSASFLAAALASIFFFRVSCACLRDFSFSFSFCGAIWDRSVKGGDRRYIVGPSPATYLNKKIKSEEKKEKREKRGGGGIYSPLALRCAGGVRGEDGDLLRYLVNRRNT